MDLHRKEMAEKLTPVELDWCEHCAESLLRSVPKECLTILHMEGVLIELSTINFTECSKFMELIMVTIGKYIDLQRGIRDGKKEID